MLIHSRSQTSRLFQESNYIYSYISKRTIWDAAAEQPLYIWTKSLKMHLVSFENGFLSFNSCLDKLF
jgi:hypothetical protein